ncbi:hypothetical protein ACLB2K_062617 [Fragaria x ananassa]
MADTMHRQSSAVVGGAALESLLHALDPISLLLSHNPVPLSEPEYMERGPRYNAYAELRESKLRSKYQMSPDEHQLEQEKESKPTPVKKQVKFQVAVPSSNVPRRKGSAYSSSSCVVAQSVPDFSAVLRREKENRKPASRLETTPPWSKGNHSGEQVLLSSRGSKSASAVEKNRLMSRKSYASLEELKGLSSIAASAINCGGGENRTAGRIVRATAKNQYFMMEIFQDMVALVFLIP